MLKARHITLSTKEDTHTTSIVYLVLPTRETSGACDLDPHIIVIPEVVLFDQGGLSVLYHDPCLHILIQLVSPESTRPFASDSHPTVRILEDFIVLHIESCTCVFT